MKSLFDTETLSEINTRLENLSENSDRQWGTMSAGQMAKHCQGPFNIMLEKEDYGMKPNWLAKVFFKKMLYNDKPFRKNLPTAKFLKETEPRDLAVEKPKLKALLSEFEAQRDRTNWAPHPGFGVFTKQQWGQLQYKHLDHHLKQFGH
ncbi:DUF1569 domain-containing protein [Cochleicola gelatinilyticus]|uniref:DUF1569 domain-containing protein n=1 Tax=Cochleicola gelatinilyticus TaxID=1763537 RepID=A0A167IGA9_9FLAO|nr:DUF1569 domain-containing protein [Cochleicola gelatinilyticus]OAB79624.1 hypothetical protein ULVI_02390 [Cochleicola gelatinilyticus]